MSYLIGIDIGGTNLRVAVINKNGDIIEIFKANNEVEKGPKHNLDKLISHIKNEWKDYKFEKVGVGAPGPLDLKLGKILKKAH